ncbi:MAG: hypothetical protein GY870_03815 [archaeon]|nr:hypothetical protein [archaeon]
MGLKSKLPGKGLALEVTLEDVTIEAIDLLANISGVDFVIQRGERIRILSDIPSFELSVIITEKLEKNNILIHSIELKVEIDMVDYFTVVSSVHQTQKYDEDGKLKEDDEGGALRKIGQNLSNEDVEISKVIKNAPKLTKKVVKKKKTAKKKKSSKKSSKKPKKKPTKKASKTPKSK